MVSAEFRFLPLKKGSRFIAMIPANSNDTIVTAGVVNDQNVQTITTSEGTVLVSAVNQSGPAVGVVNSQHNGNSSHHNSNPSGMVWTFSSL